MKNLGTQFALHFDPATAKFTNLPADARRVRVRFRDRDIPVVYVTVPGGIRTFHPIKVNAGIKLLERADSNRTIIPLNP